LLVIDKRQEGWTDRAQILCGTLHEPRESLWTIKFGKANPEKLFTGKGAQSALKA